MERELKVREAIMCSTMIVLLLAFLSSLPVFADRWPRASAVTPLKSSLDQSGSPWGDFAPEGEEFSVLVPQSPQVTRGTLDRDVPVNFRVYRMVHDNVLMVIQSYESAKPKELVKDLFWVRRKHLKFERNLESNGFKGKAFTQRGEGFFDKGLYFITHNHIYIVEAARRDAFDPAMDQFLRSFTLRTSPAPPVKPATSMANAPASQMPLDHVYGSKEITRQVIILSKQEAGFTWEARDSHITGTVTLKITLSTSGDVNDIEVLSGLPKGLTKQAIEASKTIIFIPAEKDGQPVSQRLQVEYFFMLR
jgi:TonB family protein